MMDKPVIVFNVPDRDTPGFPMRVAKALEFQERLSTGEAMKLADWKALISFLSSFVQADSPEQAEALLNQCSQAQFEDLLAAVGAGQSKPEEVVPPQNGGASVSP